LFDFIANKLLVEAETVAHRNGIALDLQPDAQADSNQTDLGPHLSAISLCGLFFDERTR